MADRKTIAFKGSEAQKARVDDVAEDLGMSRNEFLETVVMAYVEHYERDLTHESELADINKRSHQLSSAVRRLDVAKAVEKARAS